MRFRNDSLLLMGFGYTPWANYHFAALEDSFLYTINGNGAEWTCINIADPESIFIYRSAGFWYVGTYCGLEVIDGYAYGAFPDSRGSALEPPYSVWTVFNLYKIDMINSGSITYEHLIASEDRNLGSLTSDGSYIYYANSVVDGWPDWTIGESYLYVWDTDTSYDFDSKWDGQGVIGIEVINDHLLAAGFAHGFSVLNIDRLDSIYEVAYYLDEDSTMDFTHFAMKESRIYAMGHPRAGYVRLYMFDVGDSVETGQCEAEDLPTDFRFWNYPNPFNSSVKFTMDFVPEGIEIYDVNGRLVEYIHVTGGHKTLPYEIMWEPMNLPSGIYLARIHSGIDIYTTKLIYLQ